MDNSILISVTFNWHSLSFLLVLQKGADLQSLMTKVFDEGLEGLVLKDANVSS